MTVSFSTGMVAAVLETASYKDALAGTVLRIYSGAVPADADAAIGGATLLCEVTYNGSPVTLERNGRVLRKPPAALWSGTNVATGVASFFRQVPAADDGAASSTAVRVQGTVGLTSASDMVLVDTALSSGAPFPVNSYVIQLDN